MNRRCFLCVAGAGALAACGPAGVSPESIGDVPAGNVSTLAVGSLRSVSGQPVCVGRDANGVYAMTLTCTHAGCTTFVSGTRLRCPCHGSVFDANGNVLSGPAPDPLAHFEVTADAQGNLTVHGGTQVDPSKRLAVG